MNNTDRPAHTDEELREKLGELLANKGADGAFIQEIRERFPYFTLPDALMARRNAEAGLPTASGEEQQQLMERLALNSCDPAAARRLAEGDAGSFEQFYQPEEKKATPSTQSAIDTFLSSYGARSDEEDALLERLIFNPVPDYASTLEAEEASESEQTAAPLPTAIPAAESPTATPVSTPVSTSAATPPSEPAAENPKPADKPKPVDKPRSNDLLSESLAKIFIRTCRYDKAYEILERLSLEFPEKSRYFADQLRFLRKLIKIQAAREAQNSNHKQQTD